MPKQNKLTIFLLPQSGFWIARFPKFSSEALLFGTTDIPTPYSTNAFNGLIADKIKALNPTYTIVDALGKILA